jgi:hypothetical protein
LIEGPRPPGYSSRSHFNEHGNEMQIGTFVRRMLILGLLTAAGVGVGRAAEAVSVFLLDAHHVPVVRLEKLNPPLSEPLRAILAMYALQDGGGCEGENDPKENGLHCTLTTALGVGPQCSAAQLRLVRDWFEGSIPRMSGADVKAYENVQRPGTLEEICYNSPDSASIQETWARIRVTQDGSQIAVDAVGYYLDRDEDGRFHYKSTYKVEGHSITTLSHEKIPWKSAKQAVED